MLRDINIQNTGVPSNVPKTSFSKLLQEKKDSLAAYNSYTSDDFFESLDNKLAGIRKKIEKKESKPIIQDVTKQIKEEKEELPEDDFSYNGLILNDREKMARDIGLKNGLTPDEIIQEIKNSRQYRVNQELAKQGINMQDEQESKGMVLDVLSNWGKDFKEMVEDRGSSFYETLKKARDGKLEIFGTDVGSLPKYEQVAPTAVTLAGDALGGFGEAGFKIFAELPFKMASAILPDFVKDNYMKTVKTAVGTASKALTPLSGLTKFIPEETKEKVGTKIMDGLSQIAKTEKGKEAINVLMDGTETALKWAGDPKNRDSVKFLEGVMELGLLALGAAGGDYNKETLTAIDDYIKNFKNQGKKLFKESGEAIGEVVERKYKKQIKKEALDVLDAPMNKDERVKAIVTGLSDNTTLGGLRSNPDQYTKEMADAIQEYVKPGLKHIKNNIEVISSKVGNLDDGLKEALKNSGVKFTKQEYINELIKFAKQNKTNLTSSKNLKTAYKQIIEEFEQFLKEGNIVNVLDARQAFDKFVMSKHGKKIGKLGFGVQDTAIDEIRTFGNNFIKRKLTDTQKIFNIPGLNVFNEVGEAVIKDGEQVIRNSGDVFKEILRKEHLMLSAQTRIGLKNEKFINNSGVLKNVTNFLKQHQFLTLNLALAVVGGGSYVIDKDLVAPLLAIAAVGETVYFGNKVIKSREVKKWLISVLKKSNKAGLKNADELADLIKLLPGEELTKIKEDEAAKKIYEWAEYQRQLKEGGLTVTQSVEQGRGAVFKETAPTTPVTRQREQWRPIKDVTQDTIEEVSTAPGAFTPVPEDAILKQPIKETFSIDRTKIPSYKKYLDDLAKKEAKNKENLMVIKESKKFLNDLEKAKTTAEKIRIENELMRIINENDIIRFK